MESRYRTHLVPVVFYADQISSATVCNGAETVERKNFTRAARSAGTHNFPALAFLFLCAGHNYSRNGCARRAGAGQ